MKSAMIGKIGSLLLLAAVALSFSGTEKAYGLSFEDDELRSDPRGDSGVVTKVNKEAQIQRVLLVGKEWVQVETTHGRGWIKNKDYKKLMGEKQEQTLVLKTGAEIRSRGGMESEVRARTTKPTVIKEILYSGNFWYKVSTDKGVGWVRKSQVEGSRTEARTPCIDCTAGNQRRASPVSGTNLGDIGDVIAEADSRPAPRRNERRVAETRSSHHAGDGHDHSHDHEETPEIRRRRNANGARFISPIQGGCRVTSPYGPRTHPVTGARGSFHAGQDLSARVGTPLVSPADGEIIAAGRSGNCGNMLKIKNGQTVIKFCHMSGFKTRVGSRVKQGQLVGFAGATGRVTGPHLHIEVAMNGRTVNPLLIFNRDQLCQ